MKTNLPLLQVTGNTFVDALREMERDHAVWFNTSKFSAEYPAVEARKNASRDRYLAAYRAANPTHIAC